MCFFRGKTASNTGTAAAYFFLYDRSGINVVVKDNGKTFFDVSFRDSFKKTGPLFIKIYGYIGLVELGVNLNSGVS